MQYPVVCVLSGPEKTRAKAELALEKARLTIIPPKEWPIQRQSYAAEHWPHMTPWPMVRLPEDEEMGDDGKLRQVSDRNEYVPAPHVDTSIEHGFVAVLAETEELFHAAYTVAAKHKWDLRSHHELPEKPKPDPASELFDMLIGRLDSQEQRIAELTRKLGGVPPISGAGFETGAGEFMQTGSYSAAQLRRSVFAWAARTGANVPGTIAGGLLSATDMQLSAGGSGLAVNTSVGECLIGGTEATSQGGYHGFLSSTNATTLATANATNPRIDLICATAADSSYTIPSGGTSGFVTIQAVTGTPTSGATLTNLSGAHSLPASSLLLGYALVPASATSLTGADVAMSASVVMTSVGMSPRPTRCHLASNTGIGSAGFTLLDLTYVDFDPDSRLSGGVYLCPTAGYYLFTGCASVNPTSNGSTISAGIYHNAILLTQGPSQPNAPTGSSLGVPIADILACQAGDTIALGCYSSSGGTAVASYTYMSIRLV